MDENRLPELPREAFRPMIAQSVQLEQFLGEELIFCFRDLDGVHTFTTCYGDIYKTVNALRDYVRLLESVCDQWELTGFHRATYEYHAEKLPGAVRAVCSHPLLSSPCSGTGGCGPKPAANICTAVR